MNEYLPPTITTPSTLIITQITNAYPLVVTVAVGFDEADTYRIHQTIKFIVPSDYGMPQINGLIGKIISVSGFNLTVDLDSSQFSPFIQNPVTKQQLPLIAPYGSNNLQFNNFTNWVPFRSFNDRGN